MIIFEVSQVLKVLKHSDEGGALLCPETFCKCQNHSHSLNKIIVIFEVSPDLTVRDSAPNHYEYLSHVVRYLVPCIPEINTRMWGPQN